MSYTALYRKFRPSEFDDVKGQEHIVTTLQNQIKADRMGHAYVFTGTRGTGKTTVAKIFAKAVNCENPHDGSPCGECAMCKAIAAGTTLDVVEMDAASNSGVDNIRDIIEEVSYPPSDGKFKVYILDEAHMITTNAFNALLKTLEEPPEYVIFILATTEVHKIPITILSRCQRYDFRRISIDTIADRLTELMEKENIEVEEKAIRYIAKAADGSMRDALSLLDQCIAFYIGEKLTYDNVLEVLGAVDTEIFSRMLRDILNQNVMDAISIIEEVVAEGRELSKFVSDFTWYLRNLLLIKSTDNMEDILDISTDNLALLKEEASMVEDAVLIRYIRILSDLSNQMKYASQKRVLLEVALIRLCKPEMEEDMDSIINRMANLEKKVEEGVTVVATAPMTSQGEAVQNKPVEKIPLPEAMSEDIISVAQNWNSICEKVKAPMIKFNLSKMLPSCSENNELLLVSEDGVAVGVMSREDNIAFVKNAIEATIGKSVKIVVRQHTGMSKVSDVYTSIAEQFAVERDIEVVEEDSDPDAFE